MIMTDGGIFNGQPYQPPCFARGTLIATVDGDKRVEALAPGAGAVFGAGENPNPGISGATTWKAGLLASGFTSAGITFSNSTLVLGQPWSI